jgi:hypothetical protein
LDLKRLCAAPASLIDKIGGHLQTGAKKALTFFEKTWVQLDLGFAFQPFHEFYQRALAALGHRLFLDYFFFLVELFHIGALTVLERQDVEGVPPSVEPFRDRLLFR